MAGLRVDRVLLSLPDEPLLRPKTLLSHLEPDPGQDLDRPPYDRDHIQHHGHPIHESHVMDSIEVQVEQEAEVQVAKEGDHTESEVTVEAPIMDQEDHRAQKSWWKS